MKYQVIRRMARGQAIAPAEIRSTRPAIGDLLINEERCALLARNSKTASLRGVDPLGPAEIPALHDAVLSWMAPNGFVLSGLEVDGECLYAQSWWCRPIEM